MLQKFKITSCAFILFLFGFSLMTVSPVLAADGDGFTVCDNMPEAASKLTCFRDLARSLRAEVEDMTTAASSQEAAVDDAEGTKEALKLQIEEISGWLKDKDARIADLQEQLSTASSELQEKDETIADLTDRFASFEQSQAEFDATIAELEEQLSTASSELQDKDETIADVTDRLAAAMEGSTQGSGAGTASAYKRLTGECSEALTLGRAQHCIERELAEWRDGCAAAWEAKAGIQWVANVCF